MALFGKLFGSTEKPGLKVPDKGIARADGVAPGVAAGSAADAFSGLFAEARSLNAAGRHAEALTLVSEHPSSMPENPALLLFTRASILFDWGRYREAREDYLRAAAAGMAGTDLELQLGWAHFHCGNAAAAEESMRRAVTLDPGRRATQWGLARVLFGSRRFADAEVAINQLLERFPGDVECLWLLGNCRLCLGDPPAAERCLRLAIKADPERAVVWKDLGGALDAQDRRNDAIEASATAVRLDAAHGERSDSFVNLAIEWADDGRLVEALELHERMLPQQPYVYGHLAYAQALLKAGRLAEGWQQYEFRFLTGPALSGRQAFGRPRWSGQDLRGKTILLLAEQGLGDTIHFIRYAPRLKALGANVLLRVPDGFEAFAVDFPGIDRVLERGPTRVEFDYYLNVISLPQAFGIELTSVPAKTPYLHASPVHQSRWAPRLACGGDLKIGLVWAGNPAHAADRHRSMSLAEMAPFGGLSGVRFIALQKGAREEEARTSPPVFAVENLGVELGDFRDTSAVISQLDLVLSVDTAVAHLAGALGKPVWLMLPKAAEWRWLDGREDSPWYPTMRLFRQHRQGEWGDVIERVRSALQSRLEGDCAVMSAPPVALAVPGTITDDVARLTGTLGQRAGLSAVAEMRSGILQYLPDEPLVGDSLRWYGELLQPQLDLLARLVPPASTVLEIGAGVGAHAIPLAAMIGSDGHLLWYESRPVLRQILQQNLAANRVGNATLLRRTAAGSSAPESEGRLGAAAARAEQAPLPTETLDDLRLARLDLVKVSAQTDATIVLAGATATLWRLRPSLFIAVADDAELAKSAARLREFGYRCWRMETAWFNVQNFNRRDEDIFAGETALALVAVPEERQPDMAHDGCVELS